jgi:hypothetical protein
MACYYEFVAMPKQCEGFFSPFLGAGCVRVVSGLEIGSVKSCGPAANYSLPIIC